MLRSVSFHPVIRHQGRGQPAVPLLLALVLLSCSYALAAPVIQHSGTTDPTTEGWTQYWNNPDPSTYPTGANADDGSWFIYDRNSASYTNGCFYDYADPGNYLTNAWSCVLVAKVSVNALEPLNLQGAQAVGMGFTFGGNSWVFDLVGNDPDNDGIWYQGTDYYQHKLWSGSTADAYHTYLFTYVPTLNAISVQVDGNAAGSVARSDVRTVGGQDLWFGAGSSYGQGEGWYRSVAFGDQVGDTSVPEPATLLLGLCVGPWVWWRARRRRK